MTTTHYKNNFQITFTMINESFEKETDLKGGNLAPEFQKNLGQLKNGHLDTTTIPCAKMANTDFGKKHSVPALVVRNANKCYESNTPILNNFSMTVQSGTIYSLLGSSGCGKTTLLSCCVGLQGLDSGDIRVLGVSPGSNGAEIPGRLIGYMPQELSLHNEFTIEESFTYFGRMYGMSQSSIETRMEFLLKLLDLPKPSRLIHTLSGGQKRRVSFGLAIFHSPPLLILDEPTVGVDPLLRESIWTHLRQLVSTNKTTVIITTHYIEEARQSHTVGVMRNGRLLVEKSPEDLMHEYGCPLLEQVVLELCHKDNLKETPPVQTPRYLLPPSLPVKNQKNPECVTVLKISSLKDQNNYWEKPNNFTNLEQLSYHSSHGSIFRNSLSRMRALIFKNFLVLRRNLVFLLFMLANPAIQIMLICLAIGPDPKNLNVGLINHEFPNSTDGNCEPTVGCEAPYFLSCQYLQMVPKASIHLITYESEELALNEIKKGNLWGYLSFPKNFSESILDRAVSGAYATDETYDNSRITFEIDMSNKHIGLTMQKIFFEVFQRFIAEAATTCGSNPRQTELPLNFKPPVYGTDNTNFSEYTAPSFLLAVMFLFPLCASALSYISEKKAGTLQRSLVLGVNNFEIMLAFVISQSVVVLAQTFLVFIYIMFVFKMTVNGSIFWAVVLSMLTGVAGMSMGFLVSTICAEEIQAILLVMATFMPNLILSGMFWPTESMPWILQYAGYFMPCTLGCESMRSIVTRGWPITHTVVWQGFASTIAWTILYWIFTIIVHRFSNKK